MIFYKEDRTFSQNDEISTDLDLELKDSDIKSYVNLVRYIPGDNYYQLFMNEETRRYIDIRYSETTSNYTMNEIDG